MPGMHHHQTAFNPHRDCKALAKSFLRQKAWPRVYNELASGNTTHSAQSWRNFHGKHRARVQTEVDKYKRRLQQRREDRSPHSSSDAEVPPSAVQPKTTNAVPARKVKVTTRRPAPDIDDFGTSSEEEEAEEPAKGADEDADELESSPKQRKPSAKSKGKQRAVSSDSDDEPRRPAPKPKGFSLQIPAPAAKKGTRPPSSSLPASSPPTKRKSSPAAGPSRQREPSDSPPIATVHTKASRVEMMRVDAQYVISEGPEGTVVAISPLRPGSDRAVSASPRAYQPPSSPPKPRVSAPVPAPRQPAPSSSAASPRKEAPAEEEAETESDSDSDESGADGAKTQALKAAFGMKPRRSSNASNSSDAVRDQFVPTKRKRTTSPLKEITSSQEQDEEEAQPSAKKAAPDGPSPRRLRSRGPASTAAPEPATPGPSHAIEEEVEPPSTVKKAKQKATIAPITLSQSDLKACYGVAQFAESHCFMPSQAFHAFFACCGDLKVLMALSVKPEQRSLAQQRIIEQGYWDATDDNIVMNGSIEDKEEMEERRGEGSVEFRRTYLELLGQGSREHF